MSVSFISMLCRTALRSPRLLGSAARTALPVFASVQQFQPLSSTVQPALAVFSGLRAWAWGSGGRARGGRIFGILLCDYLVDSR